MNRSGSIVVAAASAGILIAGAVATVAIVQASQTAPGPEGVTLVVDPSAVNPSTSSLDPMASGPSFAPEALPEIILPSPTAAEATANEAAPGVAPATTISARQARELVITAAPGTVTSVRETTRGGFEAFAVKVERPDGSTVTGYVSKADGVVFDWTETAAPAPAQGYGQDDEEHADDSGPASGNDDGAGRGDGDHGDSGHGDGDGDDD